MVTLPCLPSPKKKFGLGVDVYYFFFWKTEPTDYTQLWSDLRQEISLVVGPEKPLPGQASFAHLVGGYDAGRFYRMDCS